MCLAAGGAVRAEAASAFASTAAGNGPTVTSLPSVVQVIHVPCASVVTVRASPSGSVSSTAPAVGVGSGARARPRRSGSCHRLLTLGTTSDSCALAAADPRLEQAHQQVEIRPVDLIAAQERDGDRAPELPQALQDGVLEVCIVHGQVGQIPFEAMPQRHPERARAARGLGRQQAGIEQQADLAAAGAARRPPSGAAWPACRCRGSPR